MALLNIVLDLSHHNAVGSYHEVVAAGVQGIIYKATEALGGVDHTYDANRERAESVNLLWGAYHFNSSGDPVTQAEHFLNTAKLKDGQLMVLDWETGPEGVMTRSQAEAYVQHIKDKTGRFPTLYANNSFIHEQMNGVGPGDSVLSQCPLWIARYGPEPTAPAAWDTFSLWQYTDGKVGNPPHAVNGVGNCDRDMFNDAVGTLQDFWAK